MRQVPGFLQQCDLGGRQRAAEELERPRRQQAIARAPDQMQRQRERHDLRLDRRETDIVRMFQNPARGEDMDVRLTAEVLDELISRLAL